MRRKKIVMADNMPQGRQESLVWLESVNALWVNNAVAIGLTSAQTLSFATTLINARADFTSVETIRTESKTTTQDWYTASNGIRDEASGMIAAIKGFADNSDTPTAILALAGLTPTAPRQPAAPPQQASILNAVLGGNGAVTINFVGNGPIGTVWQVSRKLATETAYTFIGNADASSKSFTDATVPAGTATADYQVQGIRGSVSGLVSFGFNVKFGGADGVAAPASVAA